MGVALTDGPGEQQPVLSPAVALADALGSSVTQLAGLGDYELDLSGEACPARTRTP